MAQNGEVLKNISTPSPGQENSSVPATTNPIPISNQASGSQAQSTGQQQEYSFTSGYFQSQYSAKNQKFLRNTKGVKIINP